MLPDFRCSTSSSGGLRNRNTRSALLNECMRSELVFAPAASYSSSGQPTDTPSPLSTSHSAPSLTNFAAVAGEIGTRASDGSGSLGTKIRMMMDRFGGVGDRGKIPEQQSPKGYTVAS